MKTTHTLGPWHVSHDVGDGRLIAKEIAPNCGRQLPLATAHECRPWWKGAEIGRDEMIANAKLIAAAPELLEALRLMLRADDAICENIGSKSDQAMLRIAAIDNARAAIAKAAGEGKL